jgi:hypothetical protein
MRTLSRDELRDRRRAAYAAMDTARSMQQQLRGVQNTDARVEWSWIFHKCRKEFRRLCRQAGVPA